MYNIYYKITQTQQMSKNIIIQNNTKQHLITQHIIK